MLLLSDHKMKILFVITGLGFGGAEKQLCLLSDELIKKNNIEITIVSLVKSASEIKPNNNRIKIYNIGMKKTPFSFIYSLFKLRKIIKKENPDIIHSHMFHANILSRICSILTSIPILICTAHSSNEGGYFRMKLYKATEKLATILTNVSQEAVNNFINKKASTPQKIILMPNGVNVEAFSFDQNANIEFKKKLGLPDESKLIIAVGRLTEAKDYPTLLKALSLIKNQNARLIIIGDGDCQYKEELLNLAKSYSIIDKVYFLGLQNDIPKWMSAADVYVMSSAWEGMPLVIGEAMSCQCCIVATDCGGIIDLVKNNGFIVPKKDPISLAQKIDSVLLLPEHLKSDIGKHAREHIVNNYSIESIAKKWLSLYNNLLKKNEK